MAGNQSIQILRGTRNAIANSSEKLLPGQPLYNVDDNYLTIGSNDNDQVKAIPIACRELKGYVTDLSDQINTVDDATEKWSIKYEQGKGIQFDNDVQYQGDDITLPDKSAGTKNGDVIPGAKTLGIQAAAFGGLKYTHVNESEGNWERTPTSAEGDQSFAFGGSTHAYGDWSFAGGKDTKAYQRATVALGGGSKAGRSEEEFNDFFYKDGAISNGGEGLSPDGSILDSEGKPYLESNSYAASFGELNDAYGRASFASGSCNSVADYGFAAGRWLIAAYEQTAFGKYNSAGFTSKDSTRTIFSIGNGTADEDRSNALELTRNCMFKVGKNNSFGSQWNNGCMLFGQGITSSLEDHFGFYFGNDLTSEVHYYQPHLVIGSGKPKNISDNYFYSLSVFNGGSSPVFGVQPDGLIVSQGGISSNRKITSKGDITSGGNITSEGSITSGGKISGTHLQGTSLEIAPTDLQNLNGKITLGFGGNDATSLASISDNGKFFIKSLKNTGKAGDLSFLASNITMNSDSIAMKAANDLHKITMDSAGIAMTRKTANNLNNLDITMNSDGIKMDANTSNIKVDSNNITMESENITTSSNVTTMGGNYIEMNSYDITMNSDIVNISGEVKLKKAATKDEHPVRFEEFNGAIQNTLQPVVDMLECRNGMDFLAQLIVGTSNCTPLPTRKHFTIPYAQYNGESSNSEETFIVAQHDAMNTDTDKDFYIAVGLFNDEDIQLVVSRENLNDGDVTTEELFLLTSSIDIGEIDGRLFIKQGGYKDPFGYYVNTLYIWTEAAKYQFRVNNPADGSHSNKWEVFFNSDMLLFSK